MEKFTVDLDKVLDELEFNEEQAVRHALQHFKREDLPATKYQKPHFRPINIADADFGPCLETTMSYSSFHRKHSQDSNSSSIEPDSTSLSRKINDVKHPVVSDLIEPPTMNSCNGEKVDSYQCDESKETVTQTLGDGLEANAVTIPERDDVENKSEMTSHNETSIKSNEVGKDVQEEVRDEKKSKEDVRVTQEICEKVQEIRMAEEECINPAQVEEKEEAGGKKEEEMRKEEVRGETESQNAQEVHNKPDLLENEVMSSNGGQGVVEGEEEEEEEGEEVEEKGGTKLPDLTEVSQTENSNQCESDKVKNLDLIRIDKGFKEDEKSEEAECESEVEAAKPPSQSEPEPEPKAKPKAKPRSPPTPEPRSSESESEPEESELISYEDEPVNEIKEEKEEVVVVVEEGEEEEKGKAAEVEEEEEEAEIKPIQFQSDCDITDEELQRYLEELEEEEEAERRKAEEESKPARPDTLDLSQKGKSRSQASPGQTPLPRNGEGIGFQEDNKEGTEETMENMDQLDSVEDLFEEASAPRSLESGLTIGERRLGKVSPFWMPDHLASSCMECESKFTVIKRRHHCRACGRILCSKCCGMRATLEYLKNQEQRVCETCFRTLAKVMMYESQAESEYDLNQRRRPNRNPNPNNPMEYCSTVPPPLQVSSTRNQSPPAVLVPVGVLKREGSSKVKESSKQVMFSDGIRPGGDLTELDGTGDHRNTFRKPAKPTKRVGTPPGNGSLSPSVILPPMDPENQSFVLEKTLPPICVVNKGETTYEENWTLGQIMERLRDPNSPPLQFAINRFLSASVKIVKLDCCMKETCWVICSKGMGCVGQDEIVVLLTITGEDGDKIPKDIFLQFHYISQEAARGNTVNELGYWCVKESLFLDSSQHGGFLFIRPTYQCLNRIEIPPPPFLVGILIHKSEVPWARVFPLRLMLRFGAEFRYYPCPLVSVRFREPVYYEIGHTIMNLLADFRNLTYTIPSVRGLRIHMEANQTSILIPRNRYDQVVRALNNSNDPVLALAGNFSPEADSHLVCMQSKGNEVTYSTHAININDKPRKVTGASFVVLNGALKTRSGVSAKSSIVEDGLMVQVPSDTMTSLRTKLRNMEDWSVRCGPIEGRNVDEVVRIIWCEDDKNFNVGVKSVIDNMALDGIPSIRVHSGKDYMGSTKFIRWTEVFIIKCEDGATSAKIGDPLEVNKLSESIARATCLALTKLLELLAASGLTTIAVRATIDQDNVCYEAGSNGEKLAPIYMNSLDNELIPVLHKAASVNDSVAVLELLFHVMDQ